jgi:uncharacterized damage-inducible protein DinB
MKKFALLLFVLAFASRGVYAQYSQSELVAEWKRAKVYTKEYLDAMPADGYEFKPTPEIRSYAQQMLHLADANYFFTATASGKKMPGQQQEKSVAPTKEAVTKAVMESYDFAIEALESLKPAQLNEKVKVEGQEVTRFGAFGKAFEHQTHHRGQCTIYLRLKKITPPQEKLF